MRRGLALVVAAVLTAGACSSDEGVGDDTSSDPLVTTTSTAPEQADEPATSALEPLDDQTQPGLNGLVVDGDTLWVASIAADAVLQVDRETGAIVNRFSTDGAGPDDVAVGADGEIWTTGFLNGDLGVIAEGAYSVVANLGVGLNPVDTADDGTVYTTLFAEGATLYRLAPGSTEPEAVAEGLDNVNAFAVTGDGTILAPAGGGLIVHIDPSDGSVTTVAEGLPLVLASDLHPDGRYFALANVDGDVLEVDPEAGTSEVALSLDAAGPFDNMAFAPDGTLYVSVLGAPVIVEVSPDGTQREITVGSP